jgi:hypothetical protein
MIGFSSLLAAARGWSSQQRLKEGTRRQEKAAADAEAKRSGS